MDLGSGFSDPKSVSAHLYILRTRNPRKKPRSHILAHSKVHTPRWMLFSAKDKKFCLRLGIGDFVVKFWVWSSGLRLWYFLIYKTEI